MPTIAALRDLLEINTSDISNALHHLMDIIEIEELPTFPSTTTDLEFSVAEYLSPMISFPDISWRKFFTDKSRAGESWVNSRATHKLLLERADLLLSQCISSTPSPTTMHHSTWKIIYHHLSGLWLDNGLGESESEFVRSWEAAWPLFVEELTNFQCSDLIQQDKLTANPQCIRALRLLIRCGTEDNSTAISEDIDFFRCIVSEALISWFEGQHQPTVTPSEHSVNHDHEPKLELEPKNFLHLLPYLTASETSMYAETLPNIISESHLSSDCILQIISQNSQSGGFIDLDTGNPDHFDDGASGHALRICVDWSLLDLLEYPCLSDVGQNLFEAYRRIQVCAIRERLEELLELGEESRDEVVVWRVARGVARKLGRSSKVLVLRDDLDQDDDEDEDERSSLSALLNRIGSPRSLEVLLSPTLAYRACHELFIPLLLLIVLNCKAASTLGPKFTTRHSKLQNLLVTLIQHGILNNAFRDTEYHDLLHQRTLFKIYKSLLEVDGFDHGKWLDLADDTTHTTILEFLLADSILERYHEKKAAGVRVYWSTHFSRANGSTKIIELLRALSDRLDLRNVNGSENSETNSAVLVKYAPLFSEPESCGSESFLEGLSIWKEKYVERSSDASRVIDELCAQLECVDWDSFVKDRGP
ncbi:hypothetical protein CPB83DRAFT_846226 [Crepidotus variabilis]|uniref:Uncharacterized protein n=1 Tax=Crepidotus variabilis TaxID=179855 RepID=A0A9P6EQZ6_9AGAR|nr:hypothetical protein CPB83DRAFT_846226 [Crepidotus variabilis]